MRKGRVFIDRFSAGLDDLTRAQQADSAAVLEVLARTGRFSVFEASANDIIARTMTDLMHGPYLASAGGGYPWTHVKLTQAGRDLIATPAATKPEGGEHV